MNYAVRIWIDVLDRRGNPIPELCTEMTMNKPHKLHDDLDKLRGNGHAKVVMYYGEKLGTREYGSVSVGCDVQLTVNQDKDTIHKGQRAAFDLAVSCVDEYAIEALAKVEEHIKIADKMWRD